MRIPSVPPPAFVPSSVGYGAGDRDPHDHPKGVAACCLVPPPVEGAQVNAALHSLGLEDVAKRLQSKFSVDPYDEGLLLFLDLRRRIADQDLPDEAGAGSLATCACTGAVAAGFCLALRASSSRLRGGAEVTSA